MTPEQAFNAIKVLNPSLVCIHHPGANGTSRNEVKLPFRVYAYPHLAYFAFEAEIIWPEGMKQYPLASDATTESNTK